MAIDRSRAFSEHRGRWVAFAEDQATIVGAGKTAERALDEAKRNGVGRPILARMPRQLMPFIG